MPSPHHQNGIRSRSSTNEEETQPPKDNTNSSQHQEQNPADIGPNHDLSLQYLSPAQRQQIESAATVNTLEPRVEHGTSTSRLPQSRQHQVHRRISRARDVTSKTLSLPNRIDMNGYAYNDSAIGTDVSGAELDHATAHGRRRIPSMLQRYLGQDGMHNTLNERMFEKYLGSEVAWRLLASVDGNNSLIWTRHKISVTGDSGIDMGSETCSNINEAKNAKLNTYLPPNQGNENLIVFMGGPRRKVEHENEPYDWKTGLKRSQPSRRKRTEEGIPKTESTHRVTQNSTSLSPSQRFDRPMTQPGVTISQDCISPGHSQVASPLTRQSDHANNHEYRPSAQQSHQMLSPPENESSPHSYTSHLPLPLPWPHNTDPPQPLELYGGGVFAPTSPTNDIYDQQADPIHFLRGQHPPATLPSAEWLQLHNALLGDTRELLTRGESMPAQPLETQSSPGYLYDLASTPLRQDRWRNQGIPADMAYVTGGSNFGMQYRENILSTAQGNSTFSPPPYQDNYYFSASRTHDDMASCQLSSPEDQNSSGPGLSFGRTSTETASTRFDESSNQNGLGPVLSELPSFASRPPFSLPTETLHGVATAFHDDLDAMLEEDLENWIFNEELNNITVLAPK